MPSDYCPDEVASLVHALQSPEHGISSILDLLTAALHATGLLPATYNSYNVSPLSTEVSIPKHIPLIQRTLLEHVAPSWELLLRQNNNYLLLEQFFCPVNVPRRAPATEVALLAYSTILSSHFTEFSAHLLQRLSVEFPMDVSYEAIFNGGSIVEKELVWENYVRNLLGVPSRVANAFGAGLKGEIPRVLEQAFYINNVCIQCERLIAHMSSQPTNDHFVFAMTYLFTKLVNQGALPSAPPTTPSQPSFFQATMPSIRDKLDRMNRALYSATWSTIIANIPSRLTLQKILQSIFASLENHTSVLLHVDQSPIEGNAQILRGILGIAIPGHKWLWDCTVGLLVNKEWDEELMRSIVCWISWSQAADDNAIQALLDAVLDIWTSQHHVKMSSLSRHRYLTTLLVITVSYLPPSSEAAQGVISSPTFLSAVGYYISQTESSVRLCGMLAAEILSSIAGKSLVFDTWEGTDEVIAWARSVQKMMGVRRMDTDVVNVQKNDLIDDNREIMDSKHCTKDTFVHSITMNFDSDDSLSGYASSRSVSPSLPELAEAEKEPRLTIGTGEILRPVYISQLVDLLRDHGSSDKNSEAEKMTVALNDAEDLIRKKKSFGSELVPHTEENATNLVGALLGLQDNYNLPQFDAKRQTALIALVASCPHLAAPFLIEEFFKSQYSVAQRFAALKALALGAQELAPSVCLTHSTTFPRRGLPFSPRLRFGVLQGGGESNDFIPQTDDPSAEDIMLTPTRHLGSVTITKAEISSGRRPQLLPSAPFITLSTACFISPLISRFWLFLRDERGREHRTASYEGRRRHYGAGTGLILSPIVLAQLLRTLAVLVRLSQRSSEWLTTVAPNSLEVAVTVGTLPVSSMESETEQESHDSTAGNYQQKDVVVLTTAFELALIVLDGCLEIDNGQYISLQQTTLLRRTSDWAGAIFSRMNQGSRFGGGYEAPLLRTVTGILHTADLITSRWSRSMISVA